MSVTVKPLIQPSGAAVNVGNTLTLLYTAGSGERVRIDKFTAFNTNGAAQTLTVKIRPTGEADQDNQIVVESRSIPAGGTVDITEMRHTLKAGDTIRAIASAAASISVFSSGTIFT